MSLKQIISVQGWKACPLMAGWAWVFLFQLKNLPHDNHTSLCALRVAATWSSGIPSGVFTKADNCTASESVGRRRRDWIKTFKVWHINSFHLPISFFPSDFLNKWFLQQNALRSKRKPSVCNCQWLQGFFCSIENVKLYYGDGFTTL